jgi:hypothetical protein
MGMAALLPGMIHMLELMQKQVDDFRAQLAALQNGTFTASPARPRDRVKSKRGRLPGPRPEAGTGELTARGTPLKASYWATLTAEERRAEMRRRAKVAARNGRPMKNFPQMKPGAISDMDKFRAKMRRAAKKSWAVLTPAQRTERVARMRAGRKPKVKMAGAA